MPFQSHDRIADRCPPYETAYWRFDPVAAAEFDAEQREAAAEKKQGTDD